MNNQTRLCDVKCQFNIQGICHIYGHCITRVKAKNMSKLYKIIIRSAFNSIEQYIFEGTKEQLMTLIGCLHSTRLVQIERIDYREIKENEDIKDIDKIYFYIDIDETIHILQYKSLKEGEQHE